MTETTNWQSIEPQPAQRMSEARRQAHNALHWLARLANSYRLSEPDNEHVELIWDDAEAAIHTKPFANDITVEARLARLELQFREGGVPVPHILSFDEHTPAHVEAWILVELLHRDVDRDRFAKDLPYEGRDVMLGDHEEHEVESHAAELSALQGWMKNAAAVVAAARHDIARDTGAREIADAPTLVWPETFQLGITVALPAGSAGEALRVGLSAGDALRPEPYFFVGTVKQARSGDFDAGSILSVKKIAAENLDANAVIAFLRDGAAAARKRAAS